MANRARKPDLATEVSRAYTAIRYPKPAPGIVCVVENGVPVMRVPMGVTGSELPDGHELNGNGPRDHDSNIAYGRHNQFAVDNVLGALGGTFDDERPYRTRFRDRVEEGFKLVDESNGGVPNRWSIERVAERHGITKPAINGTRERRRNGSGER